MSIRLLARAILVLGLAASAAGVLAQTPPAGRGRQAGPGYPKFFDAAMPFDARDLGGIWTPNGAGFGGGGRCRDCGDRGFSMVVIVRDRIRAMMRSGTTLEQIKAARPTADYDTRYGATSGPWTTDQFVEAVYRTLNTR